MRGVAWRKLGEKLLYNLEPHQWFAWGGLGGGDSPPTYPKLDEIETQYQSDDSRLSAVIECWLRGEGRDEPSWRKIIWALDKANENRATPVNIRHFAEPLPGIFCHVTSLSCTVYKSGLTSDSVHTNSRCV